MWVALDRRFETVAVLGAGAGGAATAVDLFNRGHIVRLWNRSHETIEPFLASGGISYRGVLGDGMANLSLVTTDLTAALDGADVAVVSVPALGHEHIAAVLVASGTTIPIVLNPGPTGSALRFRKLFHDAGRTLPPLAELSTLAYVARKYSPETVTISGVADRVRAACLPGAEAALAAARQLFPSAEAERDVLVTALANVNLVLHPPGAVLGASWVEATRGGFRFYVDGVTPGVLRVMRALDEERRATAAAYGHELPSLVAEMARIGTAGSEAAARDDWTAAIAGGEANREIPAPQSLEHRYYAEDFGHGVVPFLALAGIAQVATPVASALLGLASVLLGRDLLEEGLNARKLGIDGCDHTALVQRVREVVRV